MHSASFVIWHSVVVVKVLVEYNSLSLICSPSDVIETSFWHLYVLYWVKK